MEQVILVNEKDQQVGVMKKLLAHEQGLLHRAFSIFIFNRKGQLLLQHRAATKYHSGGLWTNTCCSHPSPGEELLDAANRRLMEEMGMTCSLKHLFSFKYKVNLDHQLVEHELDHVFVAVSDQTPRLNPQEADEYRYESPGILLEEIDQNPDEFTEWFKISLRRVVDSVFKNSNDQVVNEVI